MSRHFMGTLESHYLVQEFSHRVVNEYTEAISTLSLAAASNADLPIRLALRAAAVRLRAFANAHRALQVPLTQEPLNLASYVTQLCACVSEARLAERRIMLTVRADDILLDPERCWRVGLILAELVTNASRHGLCGRPGAIDVEIAEQDGAVICRVCDDGRGVPGRPGRGSRIVQGLAAELGGTVAWHFATGGCTARLEFPLASLSCG